MSSKKEPKKHVPRKPRGVVVNKPPEPAAPAPATEETPANESSPVSK